jgi:hypothetical protein
MVWGLKHTSDLGKRAPFVLNARPSLIMQDASVANLRFSNGFWQACILRKEATIMKAIHFLSLLAAPLLLSNCREAEKTASEVRTEVATAGDVTFARTTFESLARGDSAVVEKIDWPVFTALGDNVGGNYTALASGVEKQNFANAFVTQFASSFRQSGGTIENFTNWRVSMHDQLRTEVAADSPNGVLTVIVSERDGVERISSINVVK